VIDNVLEVGFAGAETRLSVLVEKFEDDIHKVVTVVDSVLAFIGEDDTRLSNLEQEKASLLIVERRNADQHLVDQDTECPPIYGEVMALLSDHLWRQIFGCTTKSAGQIVLWQSFSKTVIDNS